MNDPSSKPGFCFMLWMFVSTPMCFIAGLILRAQALAGYSTGWPITLLATWLIVSFFVACLIDDRRGR